MMIKALLLSMVAASISFFLVHSQLLEKQRKWIQDRSDFLTGLLDCSYCLGHWVAAALILLMPATRLLGVFWPIDYLFTWLIISWMAGLQTLAASWLWGE